MSSVSQSHVCVLCVDTTRKPRPGETNGKGNCCLLTLFRLLIDSAMLWDLQSAFKVSSCSDLGLIQYRLQREDWSPVWIFCAHIYYPTVKSWNDTLLLHSISLLGGDLLLTGVAGKRSDRRPGLCVQAVGGGLVGRRLWYSDEIASWPPDHRPDRRPYGVRDDALYKSTFFTFYLLLDNCESRKLKWV